MHTSVVLCVLALVGMCSALKCYTCTSNDRRDSCWTWPATVKSSTNCSVCATRRTFQSGGAGSDTIVRECLNECKDVPGMNVNGVSFAMKCCHKDNCNTELPPIQVSVSSASPVQQVSLSVLFLSALYSIVCE